MRAALAPRVLAFAALLAALLALSCKPKKPPESLLVAGSTTMENYLQPVVAAFSKKYPDANVVSDQGGGAAGLIALKRGAIDVALLARDVTPEEDDVHVRDYLVARDGVAVVVSLKNPVQGLTIKQLAGVFSGEIASWKELGGPDLPVIVVDRDKASRTRKSLMDLVLGGEEPTKVARRANKAAEVVAALEAEPGAIGYMSLRTLTKGVRALAVNDVEMSRSTMLSGRYPLTRSFYLVTYRKPTPLAERFIEFVLSKEGQAILTEDGLLAAR
jgi:phosphate transport system substrate-binding protein